ncbi:MULTISPECIES: TrmB family transcriptional regulator [Halobacterium]|uniref:TrmB family transcriptional regulator n=1 Tax=Halobacterium TaxID=2239 RepID=UPI00073ED50C|nr:MULTISPECIES: TrmB family transcriptional regulator sugar-binding domain-containing protein [Halobacterium]MCG1003139.1 TrmB family transcriptional regulator [Halobacterium noricense]
MTDDQRLVSRLQQFSFSEKEASVYLAAIERGRGTPSDIAADADVSTSYVYDVCDTLERQGLVTVDDHQTPTQIRANPPSETLEERVHTMTETMHELDDHYQRPDDDFDTLELVRSRQTLLRRVRSLVDAADDEVFVTLPADVFDELADVFRDAVERGCLVLVAVSGTDDATLDAHYGDAATVVKSWSRDESMYLCIDQQRGVIAPATLLGWDHGDANAVAFRNYSTAVAIESAFLGTIWAASETLSVRRPAALPHDYGDNFRHALYDATLHRRAGHTVAATLSVRPTETTDDPHTITGTITDTTQGLVDPASNDFGMENTLYVDTGEQTVSVGAVGAFLEDYEATNVVLRDGD